MLVVIACFLHDSLTKKELKRQSKVELSPSRTQDRSRSRSREKQEGRGSPHHLTRPLSMPLDSKVSGDVDVGSKSTSLQRYTDSDIKDKAEKWRQRKGDGDPTDESSPEVVRRRESRKDDFT